MDFLIGINLVILGVVIVILWYIYKNRSTPAQQINTAEITSPIIEKLSDSFWESFTKMDVKNDKQNDKQNIQTSEMRLNLETRLGEIKATLFEEVSKTSLVNSKSLADIQTRIQTQLTEAIVNINQQNRINFETLSKANNERLTQIQQQVDKRLNESFEQHLKSFESVNKNLGEMQSTAQKMIDSTKSVEKLNNIFERTNSKAFGQFSETYLETLLTEHLNHKDWQKQVGVTGSNDKIDFVINMGDKKIGIDSKFPVTKYQDYIQCLDETKQQVLKEFFKSVLLMATDINKKYLQPGFVDTLLMFLPSDSMYNEIVNNPEISEKLRNLKVTPISPTTLFPIIVIINGYEFRLKVNENAEMIMKGLQGVSKNVDSFREEFRKLGDKIRQAQDNFDKADRNLIGLQNNILKLEHHDKEIAQDSLVSSEE
ncbi:MAG: DNA recombination protein RmuC [candidate division SR1 bacterium]|nr:DNA recombination protein RmuC [candidate division SR1 bacterium]